MNEYQKAFDTITNTLICYMLRRDLYPLPSDDEIYNAQMVLLKLVDKETPKKPIDIEFGPCSDLVLSYPTCKHEVVTIPTYYGRKYYPRCPFCGQLLKGDDEDER